MSPCDRRPSISPAVGLEDGNQTPLRPPAVIRGEGQPLLQRRQRLLRRFRKGDWQALYGPFDVTFLETRAYEQALGAGRMLPAQNWR